MRTFGRISSLLFGGDVVLFDFLQPRAQTLVQVFEEDYGMRVSLPKFEAMLLKLRRLNLSQLRWLEHLVCTGCLLCPFLRRGSRCIPMDPDSGKDQDCDSWLAREFQK